jgi:hypothetical protein
LSPVKACKADSTAAPRTGTMKPRFRRLRSSRMLHGNQAGPRERLTLCSACLGDHEDI